MKFSDGKEPDIAGYRCGNCNKFHGDDASKKIASKIPIEVPGFLVGSNKVISADLEIDNKFISKIIVLSGKELQFAKISGYALDKSAIELTLNTGFKLAKPLIFNGNADSIAFNTSYSIDDGLWRVKTSHTSQDNVTYMPDFDANYAVAIPNSIILDDNYNPITITMRKENLANSEWLQSPKNWNFIDVNNFNKKLEKINKNAKTICKVSLKFRKKEKKSKYDRYSYRDDKVITELDTHGVIYEENKILVLASLDNETTARLEKITVEIKGYDNYFTGKFKKSLKKIGAFIIEIPEKVKKEYITKFSKENIKSYRDEPVFTVDVKLSQKKIEYIALNSWIPFYKQSIDNCSIPNIRRKTNDTFLFNKIGELIAMPVNIRKVKERKSYWRADKKYKLLPSSYLLPLFTKKVSDNIDTANVPLSEKAENQMAWLGVELQPLTAQLAKANGASKLSDNGGYGGLVTFVYEDSDASKYEIAPGDIILNIYPNATKEKIKIELKENRMAFPWDKLDKIPEQYYTRLPIPWTPVENTFNKILKSIGWGNKFRLELFRQGEVISKEFIVKKAPLHFQISDKYESKPLGITVKDITFEVKRYYKRQDSNLGVLITKIDLGSKASIGGIKPYELITHIDGNQINSIEDFKLNIKDKKEIEVTVVKLAVSRIVKIKLN